LGPNGKKVETTGENYTTRGPCFSLITKYSGNKTREDEMDWACGKCNEKKYIQGFGGDT
jgi:hypothetical protein